MQFQIFLNQTVCLLRNERYKTYQTGYSIRRLGHAPGGRTCGYHGGLGSQKQFFPKFNQIWRVSYLHQWHMQQHNFFGPNPLGPWGGAKRSNIIKSQSLSQFQRFLNKTLCVFSQMRDIKDIRRDFHSIAWVMPQGWDLGIIVGGWVGSKNFFPKIQPDLVCELLTWMAHATAQFLGPRLLGPWGALGRGPKGQISLNLNYRVNFKDF